MSTFSRLQASIKLLHGDKFATIETLTSSFEEDFAHFAKANNREALNTAINELKKSPKDKAISEAISEGYKASGLVNGYIGARTGKFSAQSEEVRATFENAIVEASSAFKASLTACEAFAEKAEKTEEEKAKAKAEKAEKAEKAVNDLITAKIQAGELVRASEVHTIKDMSSQCLATELASREDLNTVLIGDLRTIGGFEGLHAAHEALIAEYATLKADYATLKASKASKASKAKATA